MSPAVSIITPTTADRDIFNERCKFFASIQDYQNIIEHLFDYSDATIGEKLNNLCSNAKGDVMVRFDSDDCYSAEYVSKSVTHLIESQSNCTGLINAYFYAHEQALWEYIQPTEIGGVMIKPAPLGATLCFYKKVWERNHFLHLSSGEDIKFTAKAGRIIPHDNKYDFCAIMHGYNTASHENLNNRTLFKPVDLSFAKNIRALDNDI